ncbi:MAG: hypothetical protein JXR14_02820 [Paracoccaceae bacterium]
MPSHIKFLFKHAVIGAFAAFTFVGLLLWFNVMNLWSLVSQSPDGPLALVVMTAFFVITFSSVQMGIAIMALGEKDDAGPGGRAERIPAFRQEAPSPVAIRVDRAPRR